MEIPHRHFFWKVVLNSFTYKVTFSINFMIVTFFNVILCIFMELKIVSMSTFITQSSESYFIIYQYLQQTLKKKRKDNFFIRERWCALRELMLLRESLS